MRIETALKFVEKRLDKVSLTKALLTCAPSNRDATPEKRTVL
jgi:hypothetical protein